MPNPDGNKYAFIFSGRKGYFLVELLVTTVILTAGILFVIDAIRMPFKAARRTLEIDQAINIVEEVFELIMTHPETGNESTSGRRQIGSNEFVWNIVPGQSQSFFNSEASIRIYLIKIHWKTDKDHNLEFPFLCRE